MLGFAIYGNTALLLVGSTNAFGANSSNKGIRIDFVEIHSFFRS
jgi:hypothetical protein